MEIVGADVVVGEVGQEAVYVSPVGGVEILRGFILGDFCLIKYSVLALFVERGGVYREE